jgi:hypothetical protein
VFGPFSLLRGDVRYQALDGTETWHDTGDVTATLTLDRGNVKVALPRVDVTLGRQAITFGKTYFWNPLDVFLAFDPRQFDRDYKPGVDAARVDVALGAFSGVNLVAAAGRTLTVLGTAAGGDEPLAATWFGSAVMGRAFTTVRGWDLSLQGGKIYGGYHVGGAAVGEIGPLEVRLEAADLVAADSPRLLAGLLPRGVPFPSASPFGAFASALGRERLVEDSVTAVVGTGHRFENTLTLEAEYFFNGAGDSDNRVASLLRFASGDLLDLSEHLVGALVSYEILPILTAQLAAIVAADDPSIQIQPTLTWSAADEVEVLAGAIVSRGGRPSEPFPGGLRLRSEFGTFPDFYFVEVKLYF